MKNDLHALDRFFHLDRLGDQLEPIRLLKARCWAARGDS
jgi:hypothetical protein